MFTQIMLDSPIDQNDINLLIKDLLEFFNKKVEEEKNAKQQPFIDQQSKDFYFLKDKIDWFNKNNIIHPDLSTIRLRIKYLIDLLETCGPNDKDILTQQEIDGIFNSHSNTINQYFPGKVKNENIKQKNDSTKMIEANENIKQENDSTKTIIKAVALSEDNKIYRIIYRYNDRLYCANMLGDDIKGRASRAFEEFKKNLAEAAKNGLTKDETTYLLEETILINPNVFLGSLNECNDFEAFSTLLDKLEPKMAVLSNPQLKNATNGLQLFSLIFNADTSGCPRAIDFERYKEMRIAMLTKSQTPNGAVIRDVVAQFENQFESKNIGEEDFVSGCSPQ